MPERPKRAAGQRSEAIPANSLVATARLAQSAERKALNLVVVGSSPTVGACLLPELPAMSKNPPIRSRQNPLLLNWSEQSALTRATRARILVAEPVEGRREIGRGPAAFFGNRLQSISTVLHRLRPVPRATH